MSYTVRFAAMVPDMKGLWESPAWNRANILDISNFRPESSSHRPRTSAKLLYNDEGIFGIFRVEDRYVRSVHSGYLAPAYKDSCVEFFVQPKRGSGYFNFEFNCGGALLCSYIIDPTRTAEGFRDYIKLPEEDCREVAIFHSMPDIVEPELSEPTTWIIEFFIPFSLLERYAGQTIDVPGQKWRANLYKCGDQTSHPHWASWSPVNELNFHLPECFGTIWFDD
ncbi:MAG: carbohydrate-binding family 9-like protein [Nitrospirae bacterium]|nr:carbohydrate-binding family 9-like protein [Nitrospirota bacterium]